MSGAVLSDEKADPAHGLTQAQLDLARADPDRPPKLNGVVDDDTGGRMLWRGRTLDGRPHPSMQEGEWP